MVRDTAVINKLSNSKNQSGQYVFGDPRASV